MLQPCDQLRINGLLVRPVIGLHPEERIKRQALIVTLTLEADLKRACRSDCLADSVDYAVLQKNILKLAEESRFFLIERFAQAVADLALKDPRIQQVTVSIQKPGALRFAQSAEVIICRRRTLARKSR
jgi:D-erythro-7,8-dihydroneopterin triphosphate epimerase